jgi:hypothetical protein
MSKVKVNLESNLEVKVFFYENVTKSHRKSRRTALHTFLFMHFARMTPKWTASAS